MVYFIQQKYNISYLMVSWFSILQNIYETYLRKENRTKIKNMVSALALQSSLQFFSFTENLHGTALLTIDFGFIGMVKYK